jgi:group II intron reverse transcriptase/maturase
MSTELSRIAAKAKAEPQTRFTSLAHLLTPEFLKETWYMMNQRGASGIDGETMEEFERDIDKRIVKIVEQLKKGSYKAPPVRRVEIPKDRLGKKTRPLGIPTVTDRLLQKAVSRIIESIFEQDFLDCSFGFRPGRSPHHAIGRLRKHIIADRVMQIYEADIRGYFSNINHKWLQRMLAQRISDPIIVKLIGKWLKAGAMIDGVVVITATGTPQGGPISCILSNIYLHFVLDLWFQKKIKPKCKGEANLVRFVDDFVVGFQYKEDAIEFEKALAERMQKFSLELVPEKTQRISFGRFAREREKTKGAKTGSFVFLGFKHVCGRDKLGRFALVRIPGQKSCRKFLDRVHDWLMAHFHWKRKEQQKHLTKMLKGFYQYFSLVHCKSKLDWIKMEVERQWLRSLKRRGQRHRLHWSNLTNCGWFELPYSPTTAIHQNI